MKKYISFSLFGSSPKYLVGLKKNFDLIRKYYPGWKAVVYHDDSVPIDYLKEISANTKLINMQGSILVATMWRFCVHDLPDVERFIIRDADSRISEREVVAVKEWVDSGKQMHIMRDHPHHGYVIMGGMWGMIPDKSFNMEHACEDYIRRHGNTTKWSMTDMDFLRDDIYPRYGSNSKMHATYAKIEPWAEDFTSPLIDRKFVGEIYSETEERGPQYKIL